jgi:hypothetical protein
MNDQVISLPPTGPTRGLKHGNTYEVVNMDKAPVDQEEYCVSLEKFMEETHDPDPISKR